MAQGKRLDEWRGSAGLRLVAVLALLTAAGCGGSTATPSAAVSAVASATPTPTAGPTATPAPRARFVPTGSMRYQRQNATATLLQDGRVLIAGGDGGPPGDLLASAELYDPRSGRFTPTGSMHTARVGQTATLLMDGRVLIAGGTGCLQQWLCQPGNIMMTGYGPLTSAELYDPTTGTFARTGAMITSDTPDVATRLVDGRVLVIEGYGKSAQLYDPASGRFARTGNSLFGSSNGQRTATLLPDGKVLVTGEDNDDVPGAELYDPLTGKFTVVTVRPTSNPQTATLLTDGRVLVYESGLLETYDPASGAFASLDSLTLGSMGDLTGTALSDGRVLFAGGWGAGDPDTTGTYPIAWAGLYDLGGGPILTDSMSTARMDHTATLLQDGSVLIAGGTANGDTALAAAELFIPESVTTDLPATLPRPSPPDETQFAATREPIMPRIRHTATLLSAGNVLIAGGAAGNDIFGTAELYEPGTAVFSQTGSMGTARIDHAAVLLPGGRVLIVGGNTCGRDKWCAASEGLPTATATAELYDPTTGTFAKTGSMSVARAYPTATLLPDGRVLVAGGLSTSSKANRSADLYDPATGRFSPTGASPLNFNQGDATATLLPNGKVLLTGTTANGPGAETYDPQTGAFTAIPFELPPGTPPAEYNRQTYDRTAPQTATLLKDGRVLFFEAGRLETYDWTTGSFASAGFIYPPGQWNYPTATLLDDGSVLFTGGDPSDMAGLYDPASGPRLVGSMNGARYDHTATLLPDGSVLVVGMSDYYDDPSAELYKP